MYTRRLKHKFERWGLACQQYKFWVGTKFPQDHGKKYILASKTFSDECTLPLSSFSKYLLGSSTHSTLANGGSYWNVGSRETPTNCSSKCQLEISQLKLKLSSFSQSGSHLGFSTFAERAKNEDSGRHKGDDKDTKVESSWIELYLPKMVQPYARLARLDKPIGTWLLAWPCMW